MLVPLSPYLFILAMEVFSLLFHKAEVEGKIVGIEISRQTPRISLLLFVDNVTIFAKANVGKVYKLLEILNLFT